MNSEQPATVEREVLGCPGVWKKRDEKGPGGLGVTGYRFGSRQIGPVHDDGRADFRFPRKVRDGLIRSGRAIPHPAFPDSRTTASYRIRSAEDVLNMCSGLREAYASSFRAFSDPALVEASSQKNSPWRGPQGSRSPRPRGLPY